MENFFNLKFKSNHKKNGAMREQVRTKYEMVDGMGSEREVFEFSYALCKLLKPAYVLETGTWKGHCALYICKALKEDGVGGKLITIEYDEDKFAEAKETLASQGFQDQSECVLGNSANFDYSALMPPGSKFGLAYFDCGDRESAFKNVHDRGLVDNETIFLLHDTTIAGNGGSIGVARNEAFRIPNDIMQVKLFINVTPRGIMLGKLNKESKK